MLPPPALSFTIPSIQEDVILDCRVYHPTCLAPASISQIKEWNKKAAIVAHPYAPLGGSMDDPVVGIIANLLLKQGFVVGTFNFRGAGGSKGRTSWQAKAEQKDYISFIGFMLFYVHQLSPPSIPFNLPQFTRSNPELHELSPIPSQAIPPHSIESQYLTPTLTPESPATAVEQEECGTRNTSPRLLLAGYSYGALITSLLPPIISSLISPFQTPVPGCACAEIRLRAECLALQQNQQINTQITALIQPYMHRRGRSLNADDILLHSKTRKPSGVRMGGGEDLRRASHDSYRSRSSFTIDAPEMVRKSVDRVRSIGKHKLMSPKRHSTYDSIASSIKSERPGSGHSLNQSSQDEMEAKSDEKAVIKAIPGVLDRLQTGYLLISPLQGIVNNLATMWTSKCWNGKESISENEMKFTVDPTLALFGDDDIFVSIKRLRAWAEKVSDVAREGGDGQFQYREVAGAGHFWHDHQAVRVMQDEIRTFVRDL